VSTFEVPGVSTEEVFAGWHAGAYSLPASVIAHGRAFLALSAAAAEANAANVAAKAADGQAGRLAAIHATIAATIATGAVPVDPGWPIVAAHRAAEDAALRADVLAEARERMADSLAGIVAVSADELVLEHWRPAFTETLAAVAKVAPSLAGVDVTDTGAVSAGGAKAAAAFLELAAARAKVDAIHAAMECLRARAHRGQKDDPRLFRDCRSFPTGPGAGRAPNGPAHGLVRLVWLATDRGAEPWCPTLGEWDERSDDWTFRSPDTAANRYAAEEAHARAAEHMAKRAAYIASRDAARAG
jgi:hypothetical protein